MKVFVLIGIAGSLYAMFVLFPLGSVPVEVDKGTTYFTSTLRSDGSVDYVSILNNRAGKGIKPEENGAVALLAILGLESVDVPKRQGLLSALGISDVASSGPRFIDREAIVREMSWDESTSDALWDYMQQASVRPWSRSEMNALSLWIERNDAALDAMILASARPRTYWPLVLPKENGMLLDAHAAPLGVLAHASWLIAARAHLQVSDGDFDRAWEAAIALRRLASGLESHAVEFNHLPLAYTMRDSSFSLIARLLPTIDDTAEWETRAGEISASSRSADAAALSILGERLVTIDALTRVAIGSSGDIKKQLGVSAGFEGGMDINPSLREINEYYDQLEATLTLDNWKAIYTAGADLINQRNEEITTYAAASKKTLPLKVWVLPATARRRAIGKHIGMMVSAITLADSVYRVAMQKHNDAEEVVITTAMALRRYAIENDHYPDSLDALVPDYLPSRPIDPFSSQHLPLAYRKEGDQVVVYSRGSDGRDDNGKPRASWRIEDEGDISLHMPIP